MNAIIIGCSIVLCALAAGIAARVFVKRWGERVASLTIAVGVSPMNMLSRARDLYRRCKLDRQMVELMNLLSQALSAGLSLQQACEMAGNDMPDPMGGEFRHIAQCIKVGQTAPDALAQWAERRELDDALILANAVAVLKATGGNLIETFSRLAWTVAERKKVEGRIRVLTSQGVFQAAALIAMPFVLVFALHVIAPEYIDPLWSTVPGRIMAGVGLGMQVVGAWWVRRIAIIRV